MSMNNIEIPRLVTECGLQNFIENMVEEIVLEDRPFRGSAQRFASIGMTDVMGKNHCNGKPWLNYLQSNRLTKKNVSLRVEILNSLNQIS